MNGPFQVAQATIATQTSGKPPARIVKVTKPFGDQSVVVPLSYDGSVKADLSSIAGENITLVHIGEKLIILFDNKSTVTLEPFFDSNGKPLDALTVEVSPGRDLTGTEFAALFPVTEDRSILPAAGDGNGAGAQASGANFTSVGVDPLAAPNPIDLLGQEDLPNFTINTLLNQNTFINGIPSARLTGVVALDEDEIPGAGGNPGGPKDEVAPHVFSGTLNHDFGPDLAGDINFGAMNNVTQTIKGITIKFTWDQATHTLIANDGSHDVFKVVVTDPTTGEYTVTLLSALHHHTDALADNTEDGATFNLTFTVRDSNNTTANGTLTLNINDDTPTIAVTANEGEVGGDQGAQPLLVSLDESIQGDRGATPSPGDGAHDDVLSGDNVTYNTSPDPHGVNPIGEMKTAVGEGPGGLQSLFNIVKSAGADGEKSISYSYAFSLSGSGEGAGVATTLKVTDPTGHYSDDTIYLVKVSDTEIVGYVGNHLDGDDQSDRAIAIRITLSDPNSLSGGQLIVDQYLPIAHSDTDNQFDFTELLKLADQGSSLGVTLTTTITDGDGDRATDSATVALANNATGSIGFQDDGPAPLAISVANGAANGLFFGGFTTNNNEWGAGSGVNTGDTAGEWHILRSDVSGAQNIQLERVGDGYRGADSPTNSVMVDLEATPGNLKLTQDIDGLSVGTHHLTFEIGAANNPGAENSAQLEVFWNGVSVGIYTPQSGVMQTISIDVTAHVGTNQLTFQEIGATGDNTGTFLANVKLGGLVIIDETKGIDPGSDDVADSPEISALFASVHDPVGSNPDMDQPQYAQGKDPVVVLGTADFGTDGPGTVKVELGMSSPNGVDSGLTTTDGKEIYLFAENGLVVGRYDADGDANNTPEAAAFALHIGADGTLSIAQYVSLHHPDAGSNDEGVYLKPGTVQAVVTVTDGDGDHATSSTDISGTVRFEDDGPSISSGGRDWTLDEDVLSHNDAYDNPTDTNDYTVLSNKELGVNWGADGAKALAFAQTILDSHHPNITVTDQDGTSVQGGLSSGGVALTYDIITDTDTGGQTLIAYKGAHIPANEIFTLTLDPHAGTTGTFSFELKGPLDHPDGSGENTLNLNFGFTATDGDNDTATSSIAIRITDDIPVAGGGDAETVKEANLLSGTSTDLGDLTVAGGLHIQWGSDDNNSGFVANRSVSFTDTMVHATDGNGQDVGLTSDGHALHYAQIGNVLYAYTTSLINPVFLVTLNDSGTGGYTFTLLGNLDHPEHSATPDTLKLTFDYTATDADGDKSSSTFTVSVVDDVPVAHNGDTRTVSEANLPDGTVHHASGLTATGHLHIEWGADTANPTSGAGSHDRSVAFTDSDVTVTNSDGTVSHLTSNGQAVHYMLSNGELIGYTGSSHNPHEVFTVSLSDGSDGMYAFALKDTLDDPRGSDPLTFTFNYTATDSDGDTSSSTFAVTVKDDVPVAGGGDAETVKEANLLSGTSTDLGDLTVAGGLHIQWGSDDNNSGFVANRSVSFTDTMVHATDGNGQDVGLTSDGHALHYAQIGNVLYAYTTSLINPVFLVTLNDSGTGGYTFTLLGNLDHPEHSATPDTLKLTFDYTATDADGDKSSSTFTVSVVDDVPVAHNDTDSVSLNSAQALTFDDVPPVSDDHEVRVPSGYHGFDFVQTGIYNPGGAGPLFSTYAPHSGDNLAFIAEKNGLEHTGYEDGHPNSPVTIAHTDGSNFTPLGAWFSSSGTEPLTITIIGYDENDVPVRTIEAQIHQGAAGGPTWVDLSSLGSVDHVSMNSPDGQYFGFDDFSYRDNSPITTGNVINGADGGLGTDANGTDGNADTFGADGFGSITWTGASAQGNGISVIHGHYGTLTVDAAGNYSYELDDNNAAVIHWTTGDAALTEAFDYTTKDGDGDSSPAKLTISVTGVDDTPGLFNLVPAVNGGEATVFENDLANGSSPDSAALTQSGAFNFKADDGIVDLTVGGTKIIDGGVVKIPLLPIHTAYGQIVITDVDTTHGTVSYTYTLTHNTDHGPVQGENNVFDNITVTVTDRDHESANDTLSIKVVDDLPAAHVDTDAAQSGQLVLGNVITDAEANGDNGHDVAGADGIASIAWSDAAGTTVTGDHGTLTFGADGSYQYQASPNTSGTDVFHYTITDGDGDTSTATLTINVTNGQPHPVAATNAVDEAALDTTQDIRPGSEPDDLAVSTHTGSNPGSGAETVSGALTLGDPNSPHVTGIVGVGPSLAVGGSAVTVQGAYGLLQIDANGNYTYTLTANAHHSSQGTGSDGQADEFTYTVTDAFNNTSTSTIRIEIKDDAPTAMAGDAVIVNETDGPVTGDNLLLGGAGDVGKDSLGADGATLTHVKLPGINSQFEDITTWVSDGDGGHTKDVADIGTYTFKADGSWTFDPHNNDAMSDIDGSFTYRITDGDGDTSEALQQVTVTNVETPLVLVGSNADDQNGQTIDHTVSNPQGPFDGALQGSSFNDTILGDTGGTVITAGDKANIVLVLDISASMDQSIGQGQGTRLDAMQSAIKGLMDQLGATAASDIRVHVVTFGLNAHQFDTYDIRINGQTKQAEISEAKSDFNNLGNLENGTNYEAGLWAAYQWINGQLGSSNAPLAGANINKVLFVSDGEPNAWMTRTGNDDHGSSNSPSSQNFNQTALDNVTGTANPSGSTNDDNTDERQLIESKNYTIEAIGINLTGTALDRLGVVEGDNGSATSVSNATGLANAVGSLAGGSQSPTVAGNDVIDGGGGNDIILGDVPFTDTLAGKIVGNTLPAGSGWAVFQVLEGTTPTFVPGTSTSISDPAGDGAQWTRADTIAYIQTHLPELAQESGRTGGNDVITGGAGDDIIYGQEGNDNIFYSFNPNDADGADGHDTVNGGTEPAGGADVLHLDLTGAGEKIYIETAAAYEARTGNNYTTSSLLGALNENQVILVSNTDSDPGAGVGAGHQVFVQMTEIEEIDVTGSTADDTLVISGNFDTTALLPSTIHFDAGAGNDTLDLSQRASNQRVVADGGANTDSVKLDFNIHEITAISSINGGTGVAITHDGITDNFTNFENFTFQGSSTVYHLADVLAFDLVLPTLTSIAIDDTALNIGDSATVTVKFSEAVTALELGDFSAPNGSLSNLVSSPDGKTWTMTLTPDSGVTASGNQITLTNASYTDLAGNAGSGGASTATYGVDTQAPAVTINGHTDPVVGNQVVFDVTFSEPVAGFTNADISFTGSTAPGNLSASITDTGNGTYQVIVTGMTGSGSVVASIGAGAAADAAGNANAASTSSDNAVDFTLNHAPTADDSTIYVSDSSTVVIPWSVLLANVHDLDGDNLTITGVSPLSGIGNDITVSINSTDKTISFKTPDGANPSGNSFSFTVTDGHTSIPATVKVVVGNDANNSGDSLTFPTTSYDFVYYNTDGGSDTINVASGQFTKPAFIDGGSGNSDTLNLNTTGDGKSLDLTGVTIANVENLTSVEQNGSNNGYEQTITLTAAQWAGFSSIDMNDGTDTLNVKVVGTMDISGASAPDVNEVEAGNLTGSDGADTIKLTGSQLNAILLGSGASINLGDGIDTVHLTSTSSDLNGLDNDPLKGVEVITADGASGAVTISVANQSEGFTLTGGDKGDAITGGGGADVIDGGQGGDTLTGGAGSDTFVIKAGNSTPAFGGSNNNGTMAGFDVITDWGRGGTADKLDFSVAPVLATTGNVDGVNSILTISNSTVKSHHVDSNTGMATFDDNNTYSSSSPLSLTSDERVAAVVQYLTKTDIGDAGATLAFTTTDGDTYIYQQTTADAGGTLVELSNVTISNVKTLIGAAIDPIVLDLDHNGFGFTSQANGVHFDINHDGSQDQVAWTNAHDGLLAVDINGNGKIDNGSELFTPTFAGGHFADGLAALASLDGNHDGIIDAHDQAFAELAVWQDANHNGATDAGELQSLASLGIMSVNLDATPGTGAIDGQSVAANGTFTYADGSKGSFVEVDLDASLGSGDHDGHTQSGTNGVADTFALSATVAGHADTIVNFNSADGDKLDLSALLDQVFKASSDVDKFVHLEHSGSNVVVQVDATGQGNFAGGSHDVAVLADFAGVSHGDIINATFAGMEHQLHLTT